MKKVIVILSIIIKDVIIKFRLVSIPLCGLKSLVFKKHQKKENKHDETKFYFSRISCRKDIGNYKKIEGIKSELPFLVTINPEEKNELVKLGNHFRPFLEKAKQVLDSNPEVMPQVFNNNELLSDYNLLNNHTNS